MKKLAAILLLGIYAITAFGVETASLYCCEPANSPGHTIIAANVNTAIATIDEEDGQCSNQHQGLVFKNHHIIGSGIAHFSARSFHGIPHTASSVFATAAIFKPPYFNTRITYIPSQPHTIPVYVLNCVYRI